MRFQLFTGLVALSSPMAALAAPQAVNMTIVDAVSSAVGTLRAAMVPFGTNINSTLAGLGTKPTVAQKNAAVQTITHNLQGITLAFQTAVVTLGPVTALNIREPTAALAKRQNVATGIADLVEFLVEDAIYAVVGPIEALGTGNFMNVLIALGAPVDYLVGYIITGQLEDSGLLYEKQGIASSLATFDALIPEK